MLVLNGSGQGLSLGAIAAKRYVAARAGRPPILMPNPFCAACAAAATAAECEAVYLPTTAAAGFLPDLRALDALLARTVAFFTCLARESARRGGRYRAYLAKLKTLADKFGFLIFSDECCSRSTRGAGLGARIRRRRLPRVGVFQSLSTFQHAGHARRFRCRRQIGYRGVPRMRNLAAPRVPVPARYVGAAAYDDEAHVEENRRLYRIGSISPDQIVDDRFGYWRPAGGFCRGSMCRRSGTDDQVALKLWRAAGVRVIPGSYLARVQADGSNPGAGYLRVATVQDSETTAEALHRLVRVLT